MFRYSTIQNGDEVSLTLSYLTLECSNGLVVGFLAIVGGFVIAPIGNTVKQNLLKIENQDNEFFETDLGSVVFGPLNIQDSVVQIPSPEELASMIENMVETLFDIGIILDKERNQMYDLVAELRQLPDDLTPPNELEDPMESPMVKLLMETLLQ